MYNILLIEAYYRLGDIETANKMAATLKMNVYQDMDYFISLGKKYSSYLMYEKRVAFYSMTELARLGETYKQPELKKEIDQKIQEFSGALNIGM